MRQQRGQYTTATRTILWSRADQHRQNTEPHCTALHVRQRELPKPETRHQTVQELQTVTVLCTYELSQACSVLRTLEPSTACIWQALVESWHSPSTSWKLSG
jgi:hypothetical protein